MGTRKEKKKKEARMEDDEVKQEGAKKQGIFNNNVEYASRL
jgi:hypothetical protein